MKMQVSLAKLEYDYKVHLLEESDKIHNNSETQKKINAEYLNKMKSDLIISQLQVLDFQERFKEFLVDHPTTKYPSDIFD